MKFTKKDFKDFLKIFGEEKFDNKKVNELLLFNNRSLWWYVKNSFIMTHNPFKFLKFNKLVDSINQNELTKSKYFKQRVLIFFFNKLLFLNELFRWVVSIFSNQTLIKPNKKNILFFAHTNGLIQKGNYFEVDRVENLRKLFDKSNEYQSVLSVVEAPSRNSFFGLRKYPNLLYKQITFKDLLYSLKAANKLRLERNSLIKRITFISKEKRKLFHYLKSSFYFYLSWEKIFLMVLYTRLFNNLINEKKIKFLFLYSTGDLFSQSAIAAAEYNNIYSGSIIHGLGFSLIQPEVPKKYKCFVPGSVYQKLLISLGCSKDNIFVSGALFLSEIKFKDESRKINNQVLFFTTPFVEYHIKSKEETLFFMKKTFSFFKKYPDKTFILKPHPNERFIGDYKKLLFDLKVTNVKFDYNQTKKRLYELIERSDFVISFGSTTSFEALILGKPSIVINLFGDFLEGLYSPILDSDAFIHINNINLLDSCLKKAFYDVNCFSEVMKKRKAFIKSQLSTTENVPERIFKEITSLV